MKPQRGIGLLLTVLLILAVAAFAVLVATSFSGSSVRDTAAQNDSTEAVYLAETAIERALKLFAAGTPCGAGLTDAVPVELVAGSGKTFQITKAVTTDFNSVALVPILTQCRVESEGKIGATNVSRKLQAIIDKNLLGGANNEDYNNPAAVGAPSSWILNPVTGFADDGGPDGTSPVCSRSAWLVKTQTANVQARASAATPVSFTLTGGSVTTISFDYRINIRGPASTCAAGVASGPAFPCSTIGGNDGLICFELTATAAPVSNLSTRLASNATISQGGVGCPDPGTPSAFTPCQNGYQAGFPTKGSVTLTDGGAGTRTMTQFTLYNLLRGPGATTRKEMFLDNIEAVNNTAIGAARVQFWRDCTVATCP